MTSEELLQISSLTYGLSEFYSICLGFFKMEYANNDTTDIPEIDSIDLFSFSPVGRGTLLQVSPITAGPL